MISYMTSTDLDQPSARLPMVTDWFRSEQGDEEYKADLSQLVADELMRKWESTFCTYRNLRIFAGTYNVNGQFPSVGVGPWLADGLKEPPDIYAIGFQELDLSQQAFLFDYTQREFDWERVVKNGLHPGAQYDEVGRTRLIGMLLFVFVKHDLVKYIAKGSCCSNKLGTGLLNRMGNKGGVGVSLQIFDSRLCFVNSHLAAGTDELERRNSDFNEIINKLEFVVDGFPLPILDHDTVIWLGDLNYRLQGFGDNNDVKRHCATRHFEALLSKDQLKLVQKSNLAFHQFAEAEIQFSPTYKYDAGTDNWDSSEKARVPAWCDRVLWFSDSGNVSPECYRSVQSLKLSDHKPVLAILNVKVKKIDPVRRRKKQEEALREGDRRSNEALPKAQPDKTEFDFGDIKFLEPKVLNLIITNAGLFPVHFKIRAPPHQQQSLVDWTTITPNSHRIDVGAACQVGLQVNVDKEFAWKFNKRQVIDGEDFLLLHLLNGRDFFLTMKGKYVTSCFGQSLEGLYNAQTQKQPDLLVDVVGGDGLTAISHCVPRQLYRIVEYIKNTGLDDHELFCGAGSHNDFTKIRDSLDTDSADSSFIELHRGVHSMVEALVRFLDSLPEPVVPTKFNNDCFTATKSPNPRVSCWQVVAKFPQIHASTFEYLMSFLKEVLKHSSQNETNISSRTGTNLSAFFGPLLVRVSSKEVWDMKHDERTKFKEHQIIANKFVAFCLMSDWDSASATVTNTTNAAGENTVVTGDLISF